jgi:hypothetical protein
MNRKKIKPFDFSIVKVKELEMEKENLHIEKRLEYLKEERVLKVPDHYFDDFAGRLRTRIANESKPAVRQSWITVYLRPALGIAAVFAVLFLAVYVPLNESSKDEKANISYNEKSVNINNTNPGNEQGDTEALLMMPQSQFLSALEAVETSEDVTTIDPQALKDYLAENSLDYYLLTSN